MLSLLLAALLSLVAPPPAEAPVERVAFGSCLRENRPAPVWEQVNAYRPDTFVWLGDNIYGDTDDMQTMADKYAKLGAMPGYGRLRDSARILYIWDDHDYGKNDAGREWLLKDAAKKVMLDFFGEPADSPRRQRDGNYDSVTLGPDGRRVQFVLLDTRSFRSPLERDPDADRKTYVGDTSPEATILGEAQWAWLEEVLTEPAEVRVICTSIQLLADGHRFEKWANFPRERERLLDLLKDVPDAIVLSGDRHSGEMSLYAYADSRVLPEITASALNQNRGAQDEPNRYRAGPLVTDANFGTLTIDWNEHLAIVELRDALTGEPVHSITMRMAD